MHDGRDPGVEHRGIRLRDDGADPRAAGGEGGQAQHHEPADDLPLDLGTAAGRVRAHERALQLGAQLEGDVPGGPGAEAGRDSVVRLDIVGQPVDDRPGLGHPGHGGGRDDDAGVMPSDGDDMVDRQRSVADGHRGVVWSAHVPIRGCGVAFWERPTPDRVPDMRHPGQAVRA